MPCRKRRKGWKGPSPSWKASLQIPIFTFTYLVVGTSFPTACNFSPFWQSKGVASRFGITNDPVNRFLTAPYAYSNRRIQAKDNIWYTRMTIILCSESREIVGMLEHSLIEWVRRTHRHICANRAPGFDGPSFDDSDTDDDKPSSPGPHFCYVVDGPSVSAQQLQS